MMAGAWQSSRLIYRAVEKDDEYFLECLNQDPEAYMHASPFYPKPQSKKDATNFREFLESKIIAVIICLPQPTDPASATNETPPPPTPIGILHLGPLDPRQAQHRHSEIGINILRQYQGKGYGSEAIEWILDWSFRRAGMHRIEINASAFNTGAVRLYERIGFVLEGRKRDFLWHDGKFWDLVMLSMLEDEWREKKSGKGGQEK